MVDIFNTPPPSLKDIKTIDELSRTLQALIGLPFVLSGKPRTDGSMMRKLIASTILSSGTPLHEPVEDYEIVPSKGKGLPGILRELLDTYIVTTGQIYNLQIWNRYPNSNSPLIKYGSGETIRCCDVRLVFVKVTNNQIDSIVVTTPAYIEKTFGQFGKPTIKHQLIISESKRREIINSPSKILTEADSSSVSYRLINKLMTCNNNYCFLEDSGVKKILSIDALSSLLSNHLLGAKLDSADTKTRGQNLERLTMRALGYSEEQIVQLEGNYPDIPEQLLEVKVQDSPTVDLGKHTPEVPELVFKNDTVTSQDIRYLIALTDEVSGIIEGIVIVPGMALGYHFNYVRDISFKCQRSIPMSFFENVSGQSLSLQ